MVIDKGLGTIKGLKADIKLQNGAEPIFCKARPVPCSLHQKLKEELYRLEKLRVVIKIERSDWATPIVSQRTQERRRSTHLW